MTIPKETTDAAFPKIAKIGSVTLRPFTLQHVLALAAMRHPIMQPGKTVMTISDQLTAVAIMAADPDALAELLANEAGEKDVRKLALRAAAEIPVEEIGDLCFKLQEQLERGFSTFVPMRREGDGAAVPLATA